MEKLKVIVAILLVTLSATVQAKEYKSRGNATRAAQISTSGAENLDPTTATEDSETGADFAHGHGAIAGIGPLGARNGFPLPGSGFGILDKGAPDLQFGLALTIPFVSLATEKLLHNLQSPHGNLRSFRSWGDLAQLLKLNVGGLVLAAVVGIGALLFLPTIFHNRGGILKGFGSNLFDNLIQNGIGGGLNKHFGYGQYEHGGYGAGGAGGAGYDNFAGTGAPSWNKYGYNNYKGLRKDSRDLKDGAQQHNGTGTRAEPSNTIWNTITATVQHNLPEISECSLYAMCVHGRNAEANSTAPAPGFGEFNEYAGRLETAYALGRNGSRDCSETYAGCAKIPKFIDQVGRYIFGE